MSIIGPPGRPAPGPASQRRALSTGTALTLIAIGAILWFAVTASAIPGLNVHAVGIILLVIGLVGLLLPIATGRGYQRLSSFYRPTGYDNPRVDEIKQAAALDDATVEEDDKYFDRGGPGSREDDL